MCLRDRKMNQKRKIEVVKYDPNWVKDFDNLSQVITGSLGNLIIGVEHVGSTSVPGLAAKPIIDLDVVIDSRDCLPEVVRHLELLGYEHEGDLGIEGREAFKRNGQDVPYSDRIDTWVQHHLYVCERNNEELIRHIRFRNYLRNNPKQALAYGKLKYQLAERFPYDINAYVKGKQNLIEEILAKAASTAKTIAKY